MAIRLLLVLTISVCTAIEGPSSREVNLFMYHRHFDGVYGHVYQMALSNIVEEGYRQVDGTNAQPGGVSYIRGYYHLNPSGIWYGSKGEELKKLRVCSMAHGNNLTRVTFHTLFDHPCENLLDLLPDGSVTSVAELSHIHVPVEEHDDVITLRAVICQGHEDMLYGFVTRTLALCPYGQLKVYEFEFESLGTGLFCPELEKYPGMEVYYEMEDDTLEKSAMVTCSPPYRLNRTESSPMTTLTCSENGQWLGDIPGCEYITCGSPLRIQHGFFNGSSYGYKQQQVMTCNPGYDIDVNRYDISTADAITIHCLNTSQWSSFHAACVPKDCGAPPVVEHGTYMGDIYSYASTLELICDAGYISSSNANQRCGEAGAWTDSHSMCDPVNCGKPAIPVHSSALGDDFTFGSSVAVKCEKGYTMPKTDSPFMTCEANGGWSNDNLTCLEIMCDELLAPVSGSVNLDTFAYGSVADFTCDEDFDLIGEVQIVCKERRGEGEWSHTSPICRAKTCLIPSQNTLVHGVIKYRDTGLGAKSFQDCECGYQLRLASLCENDGWTGFEPYCEDISCGEPTLKTPLRVTQDNHDGNNEEQDNCTIHDVGSSLGLECPSGYQVDGVNMITCGTDRAWHPDPSSPVCSPGQDGQVRLVAGSSMQGRLEVFYQGSWGTVCDDVFDVSDAQVVCRQLGFSGGSVLAPESVPDGTGDILLDDLGCTGNEQRLVSCPNRGWRTHNCGHSEDVGVSCNP